MLRDWKRLERDVERATGPPPALPSGFQRETETPWLCCLGVERSLVAKCWVQHPPGGLQVRQGDDGQGATRQRPGLCTSSCASSCPPSLPPASRGRADLPREEGILGQSGTWEPRLLVPQGLACEALGGRFICSVSPGSCLRLTSALEPAWPLCPVCSSDTLRPFLPGGPFHFAGPSAGIFFPSIPASWSAQVLSIHSLSLNVTPSDRSLELLLQGDLCCPARAPSPRNPQRQP